MAIKHGTDAGEVLASQDFARSARGELFRFEPTMSVVLKGSLVPSGSMLPTGCRSADCSEVGAPPLFR